MIQICIDSEHVGNVDISFVLYAFLHIPTSAILAVALAQVRNRWFSIGYTHTFSESLYFSRKTNDSEPCLTHIMGVGGGPWGQRSW